jgi:predicted nucleic acid-binding Zn ribbon protein
MPYRHFFFSVSSVLTKLAKRLGLEAKLLEAQLRRHWPEIAGEQIAAHTRPDQIRFKKLHLIVANSVWLQQLTFLKPTLLQKINEAAGSEIVADILFRVGEIEQVKSEKGTGGAEESHRPAPTADAVAEAASHAASIKDPELRARLTEVMAEALSHQSAASDRPGRRPRT